MKYCGITKEKGEYTQSNESAPKYIIIKDKSVIATSHASLLQKAESLIHMKAWSYACSLISSGISMNGTRPTKAGVFLTGIASQLTVIIADIMNCPQYI